MEDDLSNPQCESGWFGCSAGNLAGRGYVIPMLQDTLADNAWSLWKANLRDFILDAEGRLVSITVVSSDEGGGGVGDEKAYSSLKTALMEAASP